MFSLSFFFTQNDEKKIHSALKNKCLSALDPEFK